MKAKRHRNDPARLLVCTFSTGFSYSDRFREAHGGYQRAGFLSFGTGKFTPGTDTKPHPLPRLVAEAREHASKFKVGDVVSIDQCGHQATIGYTLDKED